MEAEAAAKAQALLLKAEKVRERESSRGSQAGVHPKEEDLRRLVSEPSPNRSFSGLSTSSSIDENTMWHDDAEKSGDDPAHGEEAESGEGESEEQDADDDAPVMVEKSKEV